MNIVHGAVVVVKVALVLACAGVWAIGLFMALNDGQLQVPADPMHGLITNGWPYR